MKVVCTLALIVSFISQGSDSGQAEYCGKHVAVLLETEECLLVSSSKENGGEFDIYNINVKILKCTDSSLQGKTKTIKAQVRNPLRPRDRSPNWFPLEKGRKCLVSYDRFEVDNMTVLDLGSKPEALWNEVLLFESAILGNNDSITTRLKETIANHKQDVGVLFFRLLFEYKPAIFQTETFNEVILSLLNDAAVMIEVKSNVVVSYQKMPDELNESLKKALAVSIAKLLLTESIRIDGDNFKNLSRRYCDLFLASYRQNTFKISAGLVLDEDTITALKKIVSRENSMLDRNAKAQLMQWLSGK